VPSFVGKGRICNGGNTHFQNLLIVLIVLVHFGRNCDMQILGELVSVEGRRRYGWI